MKTKLALLLVLLQPGLLNSNATRFSRKTPANSLRQADTTLKISRPDPAINTIDSLLKEFNVDQARRNRVAQAIVSSSRKHNVDARLIASVMIVESRGNPFAISHSDAVGIMQIHVPTWAQTLDEEGINLFKIGQRRFWSPYPQTLCRAIRTRRRDKAIQRLEYRRSRIGAECRSVSPESSARVPFGHSHPIRGLCTRNISRALIERPYSREPQAVGAVREAQAR